MSVPPPLHIILGDLFPVPPGTYQSGKSLNSLWTVTAFDLEQ